MSTRELCARYEMALEMIVENWDGNADTLRRIASLALKAREKTDDEQAGAVD